MSIEYTWEIKSLKTKDEGSYQDIVRFVHWTKTGVDENGKIGVFTGTLPMLTDIPEEYQFIPYTELTKEIVLNWVQDSIDEGFDTFINNQIKKQIDHQYGIDVGLPKSPNLPWV